MPKAPESREEGSELSAINVRGIWFTWGGEGKFMMFGRSDEVALPQLSGERSTGRHIPHGSPANINSRGQRELHTAHGTVPRCLRYPNMGTTLRPRPPPNTTCAAGLTRNNTITSIVEFPQNTFWPELLLMHGHVR
ncbi:hypothetical protein JZ751_001811 [Albula glossodonta]|uniref:Uncharacterized protein n=1 Tax=Albula glossodonta TaxID=121402 RepID=A0A8T2PUZ6_9TELE|nr:hypothetical protein JZ751_001811 [Albula glossodonta]